MIQSPLYCQLAQKKSLVVQTPKVDVRFSCERSPLIVPMPFESFAQSFGLKNSMGLFLGRSSDAGETEQRRQYAQIRRVARANLFYGVEALEPTPMALERTKTAAQDFFSLSYQLVNKTKTLFPLAGRNKCLGMVAVPNTQLVIIAISQDKDPSRDIQLRDDMIRFLHKLNRTRSPWRFELACIPTKAQYLMPRTFDIRVPQAASEASVKPHTRCVEVALMAALCKAGRTKSFIAADVAIIAFGGALWATAAGEEAVTYFQGVDRNIKYREKPPLEVTLSRTSSAWIDIWEPCPEHCAIYKYEMLAIASAGGFSGSFFEPRAERSLLNEKHQLEKKRPTVDSVLAGVSFGLVCASLAHLCHLDREVTLSDAFMTSAGSALFGSIASLSLLFAIKNHRDRVQMQASRLNMGINPVDAMPRHEDEKMVRCRACTF